MTSIYDQHAAAFANVSAYVILRDGVRVATIAFKFPRDGAGRLFAYVHWIGAEMVRGYAAGGGYDKRSAACAAAVCKMALTLPEDAYTYGHAAYEAFRATLAIDDGMEWHNRLRAAGFEVVQAV
jgi:hypothetical protein